MRGGNFLFAFIFFLVALSFFSGFWLAKRSQNDQTALPIQKIKPKPLEKYTIENLSKEKVKPGKFVIEEEISQNDKFSSYLFSFSFSPDLSGREKKVSGMIDVPFGKGPFPIIIMLRGYVDKEIYKTGVGTRKAAAVFAKKSFITIAPDFLGYGKSDPEANNIFEARFQTYTTVLSLIESLYQIEGWDKKNLFFWAHSNGGQIALSVLEITSRNYPTTLWAPVSKSFPYSILYYTEELEDRGKYLRRELARFEELYDVERFSIDNYFDRINTDLQIHQGTADKSVPATWSEELVSKLRNLNLKVDYFEYPGADHNLVPHWGKVVNQDLLFFQKHIK